MLLRNESRIKHVIQIKLVFDDNTQRELEIQERDCVQVSYRRNGCLRQGVGIIKEIKPYIHTKKFSLCKRESAVITLDMSEGYVCCVDKIDLFDIVDIRKVHVCKCKSGNSDSNNEDNKGCCCCHHHHHDDQEQDQQNTNVGAVITEKGVVIND